MATGGDAVVRRVPGLRRGAGFLMATFAVSSGSMDPQGGINPGPVIVTVGVLCLAWAFRVGTRMAADTDGLV